MIENPRQLICALSEFTDCLNKYRKDFDIGQLIDIKFIEWSSWNNDDMKIRLECEDKSVFGLNSEGTLCFSFNWPS